MNELVPRPRNGLSLCAGGGGLDMGLMLAEPGFHTRCWVEWEEYPRSAIVAGQREGYFAQAPIWDDLCSFDARPFAGAFDTLLAGYPCQPFSQAGQRKGEDDERHLWPEVARVIRELGPGLRWVFLENVSGHVTLGLESVLRELRDMGFAVAAGLFTAAETGAPHERERVFIVAYRGGDGCERGAERDGAAAQGRQQAPWRHDAERRDLELADADGRHPGAEREQRGGEQRLHAEGGSDPCAVGDASGVRWRQGRAEPELRCGRDAIARTGGAVRGVGQADASSPEPQGQQRGERDPRGRQEPNGHPTLCGGAGLFPPGPADMGGWAWVFAVAPHLAPAASFGDLASFTSQVAAMAQAGLVAEEAAEPTLRRMADGLALRSRALRLLGNGVVPLAAGHAWRTLSAAHGLWPLDLGAAGRSEGAGPDGPVFVRAAE